MAMPAGEDMRGGAGRGSVEEELGDGGEYAGMCEMKGGDGAGLGRLVQALAGSCRLLQAFAGSSRHFAGTLQALAGSCRLLQPLCLLRA